jgi:ankyrin repeat protein
MELDTPVLSRKTYRDHLLAAIQKNESGEVENILTNHNHSSHGRKNRLLVEHYYKLENVDEKMPPLHIAVACDFGKCVRSLLAHGADCNDSTDAGNTSLHFVKSPKAVKELLACGAKVNHQNAEGNTPLWNALFSNSYDCFNKKRSNLAELLRALLGAGANATIRNKNQRNVLTELLRFSVLGHLDIVLSYPTDKEAIKEVFELAVKEGTHKDILEVFEKHSLLFFPKINPALLFTLSFKFPMTTDLLPYINCCARLFAAAKRMSQDRSRDRAGDGLIMNQYGLMAKYITSADLKALFSEDTYNTADAFFMDLCNRALSCIIAGNAEELKTRLKNYPFVVAYDPSITEKMLNATIRNSDNIILELLLRHKIDCKGFVSDWQRDPWTPGGNYLHHAVNSDSSGIIRSLVKYGVDYFHVDWKGLTPLQYAVKLKKIACIKVLNEILQKDCYDAFKIEHYKKAKKILLSMTDINVCDEYGNTLAHLLPVFFNNPQLKKFIGLLCSKGADFNIRNRNNDTPLWHLVGLGSSNMALHVFEMLLSAGADVNAPSRAACSLLDIVLSRKNFEVAELFLQHGAIVDKKDLGYAMPAALREKMQLAYDLQEGKKIL